MTNEEIEKRAQELFDDNAIGNVCRDDWHDGAGREAVEAIAEAMREMVVKTLEHAITIAEEQYSEPGWNAPYKTAGATIGSEIRALKDSLN